MTPLRHDAEWFAVRAERSCAAELQAFYEANPEYWLLTHGHPPQPDAAEEGFDFKPPKDVSYSDLPAWLIRDTASDKIIGEVSVATDLLAPNVTHLAFFIVETSRLGTGLADEIYAAYEAWAMSQGARWLRLGVVEANLRAQRFWQAKGYVEVCRQRDYELGELRHTLLVMVKSLPANSLDEYLRRVPRDRRA